MIQNRDHSEMRFHRLSLSCVMVGLCTCALSHAQEPIADVVGEARAKAGLLLRVTFPSQGEVAFVAAYLSSDGEAFHDVHIGDHGAISYGTKMTTVLVSSLGRSRSKAFVFDKPGTYWLKWRIRLRDPNAGEYVPGSLEKGGTAMKFVQEIEVGAPLEADLRFLSRISEPKVMRLMYGDDFFERQTGVAKELYANNSDLRAVNLLGTIMSVNTNLITDTPLIGCAPKGDLHKTAEELFSIATELPDSSYAPYVAYYAGCCFLREVLGQTMRTVRGARKPGVPKDRAAEAKAKFALTKNDPNCAKALRAFRFASERGDDYLAPRAFYQQAVLRTWNGAFDDAESLLAKSEQMAPGAGTIENICASFRKEMNRLRSEAAGDRKVGP